MDNFPLKSPFTYYFKIRIQLNITIAFIINLEKSEVSSANILDIDAILSGRSLMHITNKRDHNKDPCGTPANIFYQREVWPFKTTLCLQPVK